MRWTGRFAPTGIVSNGLSGTVGFGIGHLLGGPEGGAIGAVALPAAGFAAKNAADNISNRNVQNLMDIIMAGGTKAATQAAPNAAQRAIDANRTDLGRLFMGAGIRAGADAQNGRP
jgi:hypothetical protein